jgi:hypothetical protein
MKDCPRVVLSAALSVLLVPITFAQQSTQKPPPHPVTKGESGSQSGEKSAPPTNPITLEQTKEMFDLMHFRSTMLKMLHANLQQQRQRAPFIPDDVWQDFETSFGKADFVPVFLPVYQKYLSEADATRALEFYRTPAGQHVLGVMPALMQDVAAAAQMKGDQIAQQVFERHHQEIEDAQKKFTQQMAPGGNSPSGGKSPDGNPPK